MSVWCRCHCHSAAEGDLREAQHHERPFAVYYYGSEPLLQLLPMIPVDFWLECLVAQGCTCSLHHRNLFHAKRPGYLPPKPWTPDATGDID